MQTTQQTLPTTDLLMQERQDQRTKTIDITAVYGVKGYCENIPTAMLANLPFTWECDFFPNAQSALHLHPNQDETYQILSGTLDLWLDGVWHKLSGGQGMTIPKGSIHAFRNTSGEAVRLINTHSPGLRFRESQEVMERLIQQGKITGMSGFKNTLYLSLHTVEYRDVLILVKPPDRLVKLAARFAGLLGYSIK